MRAASLSIVCLLVASGCLSTEDGPGPQNGDTSGQVEPDPPPTDGDALVLSVGDHWVQRAYYEDNAEESVRVIEYVVEAKELIRVGSEDVSTYRIQNKDGNRTFWLRTSDWALVQTAVHGETSPVDPACLGYAWPSELATTWTHACRRLGTDVQGEAEGEVGQQLHSRVEAEDRVAVPAGEFAIVRVKTTVAEGAGAEIEEYFAAEACFPARTVIHGGESPLIIDLLAYECDGR